MNLHLHLEHNKIQMDTRGKFSIEKKNENYTVSKMFGDSKNIEYRLTDKKRTLPEFKGMCTYHQTSSHSHFTQKNSSPNQHSLGA